MKLFANRSQAPEIGPFAEWADEAFEGIDLANAKADNWVRIAPYGDHPHSAGMQRFAREDADAIVSEFKGDLIARTLGLPWYIGHPDHPAFANADTDKTKYAKVRALEAREDGLWGNLSFSPEGKALVANRAFKGHSPNWYAVPDEADPGVWRPRKLKSVGWTNQPNLKGVEPILHANQQIEPPDNNKPEHMKALQILIANGALKPGAEEKDLDAGIEQLANQRDDARKAFDAEKAAREKAEQELANAKADEAERATELANARKRVAEFEVDSRIAKGAIVAGDRDAKLAELANAEDFDAALKALPNEAKVPTGGSQSGNLAGQHVAATDRSDARRALANSLLPENGNNWDRAWEAAKRKQPQLFTEDQAAA